MSLFLHFRTSRVNADAYCALQGIRTYLAVSWSIREDSCASFVLTAIPEGTSLSVDAASCAALTIDEACYELRTDICKRGLLCLVHHCEGLLRLDIATTAYCASLKIGEDSCASTCPYHWTGLLLLANALVDA